MRVHREGFLLKYLYINNKGVPLINGPFIT